MRDVLVLGDVAVDVVVHGGALVHGSDVDARIVTTPGGAGANVAIGLARAGLSVTMVGCVGTDHEAATRSVREAAVHLVLREVPDAATGTVVVFVDGAGERTMAADRGANLHLRSDDVTDALLHAHRHLHISGYALFGAPRAATLEILGRARSGGLSVSLDPASAAPLRSYGAGTFLADTAGIGLLLPNADEAAVLTGCADPADAARLLARSYAAVAVTCGADGAVWTQDGGVLTGAAGPGPVVDSVGAGDAFTAGALAATLRGEDAEGCLTAGLAAAARCVAVIGARG